MGGCEFTCQCPFTTARGWGSPIRLNPGAQPVPESGWGVPTYFAAHKPGPLGPLQAGPRPPAGRSASFQVGSVTASSKPPQPTSSLTFLCSPVPHPASRRSCYLLLLLLLLNLNPQPTSNSLGAHACAARQCSHRPRSFSLSPRQLLSSFALLGRAAQLICHLPRCGRAEVQPRGHPPIPPQLHQPWRRLHSLRPRRPHRQQPGS